MQGRSYPPDCPVAREDLRYLQVLHRNAEGQVLVGEMIAGRQVADELLEILRELFDAGYPIERMRLVELYDGDDEASMQANNSSCFNYRSISTTQLPSKHGRGEAGDINPLYNPSIRTRADGSRLIEPATGTPYLDRSGDFPYKIVRGDPCWQAFRRHGFVWGGGWASRKDYQHFEKP